jgi:hypothetical protein
MKRREFISGAAVAAVAAVGMSRVVRAQTARQPNPATLARIAIMTFNFNGILKLPNQPASQSRTLDVFDVPQMLADTYGVHNVEFQHTHIASTEESYLRELRGRLDKSQSRMSNVNLEFGGMNISATDPAMRQQAVDLTKHWVDYAIILGCPRVMINQGPLTEETKAWAIPALKEMVEYGKSKGIKVSVETRLTGGGGGGNRGRGGAPAGPAPAAGSAPATATPAPATAAQAPGTVSPQTTAGAPLAAPPLMTVPPTWVLLAEVIKNAGASSNVDIGNVNAQDQGELLTVGNIHTRISPAWDLPTALRFINGPLGYTGLFSIEAPGGHDPVRYIYNVILDTL